MQADWIEIKRGDVLPQYSGIHVTINSKGFIAMNAFAYKMLGSPPAFLLLYDAANHRIGLKPAERSTPNAYPALKSNRTGIMVKAHRLLREQRIILPLTMQFDEAEIDTDGILVLDLRIARPSRRALGREKKMFSHE